MPAVSSRASSSFKSVTAASQQLTAMKASQLYRLVSSVDTWVAVGTNPTAAAADNSHFLGAGRELYILPVADGELVAVLRVAAVDGVCTLSIVEP
jgi:hypothetical protein